MTDDDTPTLDAAYGLKTPQDNLDLYASWAKDYDKDFAQVHGYILPQQVVSIFAQTAAQGHVLDIGVGTGLVGEHLRAHGYAHMDGTDISPDMLAVAQSKGLYGDLIEADLTKPLPIPDATYDCLVSAGTFTLGHVGPEAFDELLRIAKPGAVFAISINNQHFGPAGFEDKFAQLATQISNLTHHPIAFYAPDAAGPHSKDTGVVSVFEKT